MSILDILLSFVILCILLYVFIKTSEKRFLDFRTLFMGGTSHKLFKIAYCGGNSTEQKMVILQSRTDKAS